MVDLDKKALRALIGIMRDKAAGRRNKSGDVWGDFWCDNAADAIEASLSLPAAVEWRTMDSAPKDEIIWLANENIMRLGFWQAGEQHENHGTVDGGWIDKSLAEAGGVRGLTFKPTLWYPCPSFPASPSTPAQEESK